MLLSHLDLEGAVNYIVSYWILAVLSCLAYLRPVIRLGKFFIYVLFFANLFFILPDEKKNTELAKLAGRAINYINSKYDKIIAKWESQIISILIIIAIIPTLPLLTILILIAGIVVGNIV